MNKINRLYTYTCSLCELHTQSIMHSEYENEGETTVPDTIGGDPVPGSIIRYCPTCDANTRHKISDTEDLPSA